MSSMYALDALSRGFVVQALNAKRGLVWSQGGGATLSWSIRAHEMSQLEISQPVQKNVETSRARSTECVEEDPKVHCRRKEI